MNSRLRSITVIFVVLILTLFLPGKIGDSTRSFGTKLTKPLTSSLHLGAIWLNTRYTNLRNIGHVYDDNAKLQNRVIELEQQVAGLSAVAHENNLLRDELGVKNTVVNWGRVQATVINRLANNPSGEAVIDQGSNAGLKVGQAVTSKGMLVGQISQVTDVSAVVTLVTSSQARVQAELADNQALGLVTGSPTGLRLIEIDQGVEMKSGMIVQTSGITLGGTMPRGLVVGQIDRVISEPNQSSQAAIIHSPILFDQLRTVFVVTAPQ